MGRIKVWLGQKMLEVKRQREKRLAKRLFFKNGSYLRRPLLVVGARFLEIGRRVNVDEGCRFQCYASQECQPKLVLGDNVCVGFGCSFLCSCNLVVGEYVRFANDVFVTTENHGHNPESGDYMTQQLISQDVVIGKHCWIGDKVTILPGVCIGEWSVIGANSVVTKSIPSYSIAVGNPARVIKRYSFEKHMWVSCCGKE